MQRRSINACRPGACSGVVTFAGGTGKFRGFHGRVDVTFNERTNLWEWDGTYSFIPPGKNL